MNSPTVPPLLDELLRMDGPSGYEGPVARVWRDAAAEFAEVSGDRLGNSIARIGDARPLLAVFGHIDEIGLIINHIDEHGFLWFAPLGYWDPQVLVGQRVKIRHDDALISGVVNRKPLALTLGNAELGRGAELGDLHIDIGARSGEQAEELVSVGDPVVIAVDPLPLIGDRIAARALDDRLGAYVALESLRRCAAGAGPVGAFAAVASVQEEIGINGARVAAYGLEPDIAIAVDMLDTSDIPGASASVLGGQTLGCGPVIGRGPTISPIISNLLIETAKAEGIPYTTAGYGLDVVLGPGYSSDTDADGMHVSRAGVATGVLSIPVRYMHTPTELVELADVEATIQLLTAFASSLNPDIELER